MLQLRAERPEIVDLSVEGEREPIVRRSHRLMTGHGEVEDGQSPMREGANRLACGAGQGARAVVIWSAVRERSRHRGHDAGRISDT
jgi:hypothetical protein